MFITPQEAKMIMATGAATVLDVRTREEYDAGHIPGAVLYPVQDISEDTIDDVLPDLTARILVYCRSGKRAAAAVEKLRAMDYESAVSFGGIESWPYEIEK